MSLIQRVYGVYSILGVVRELFLIFWFFLLLLLNNIKLVISSAPSLNHEAGNHPIPCRHTARRLPWNRPWQGDTLGTG